MKFHISEDGKVRKCTAEDGNCPVKAADGNSYHSSSVDELIAKKEEIQEKKYGATTTLSKADETAATIPSTEESRQERSAKKNSVSKKLTQTELNNLAKEATKPEDLDIVLEQGGARALNSAAKHPFLTREQIIKIESKTTNATTIQHLKSNPRYPLENLNDKDLQRINGYQMKERLSHTEANDELLERIRKTHGSMVLSSALENDKNISTDKLQEITAINLDQSKVYEKVKNNPRFNFKEVAKLTTAPKLRHIVYKLDNSDDIKTAYEKFKSSPYANDTEYMSSIASNNNTPESVLEEISDNESFVNYDSLALSIYENPNSNERTLEKVSKNKTVQSMKKLDELEKTGALSKIRLPSGGGVGGKKYSYRFDPVKVKELGLNGHDIDTLVRYKYNDWLWGTSYNEETGGYIGSID